MDKYLILLRKVSNPLFPQLWVKLYHSCSSTRMVLALHYPWKLICCQPKKPNLWYYYADTSILCIMTCICIDFLTLLRMWHNCCFLSSRLVARPWLKCTVCPTISSIIASGRIVKFIPFPRVLVLDEMLTALARIWTWLVISYNDSFYAASIRVQWYYPKCLFSYVVLSLRTSITVCHSLMLYIMEFGKVRISTQLCNELSLISNYAELYMTLWTGSYLGP